MIDSVTHKKWVPMKWFSSYGQFDDWLDESLVKFIFFSRLFMLINSYFIFLFKTIKVKEKLKIYSTSKIKYIGSILEKY